MNCSLPGSSVYGILQARILEWVGIPFSRRSSRRGDRTQVSHTAGRFFTIWAIREPQLWYLPSCSLYLWVFLSFRFVHLFCFLDLTFKWNHIVLVIVWLQLSVIPLGPSMLLQIARFYSLYGWVIFHYIFYIYIHIYHIFFVHSPINGHLDRFHILAVVNNVAFNIGVCISFWISVFFFFRKIPRSRVAGLYGSSVFNFLRNPLTVFHTGCPNFHSYSQCMKLPFSLHPCHHLFVVFFIVAILTGVRLCLIVVLTFILLMISDVESVFLCLWSSTSCFWKHVYSSSLPIF